MSRFYGLVAILFVILAPIQFARSLMDDLEHPERWDADFTHDPRLLPPLLAVWAVALLVLWRETRRMRRMAACQASRSQAGGNPDTP